MSNTVSTLNFLCELCYCILRPLYAQPWQFSKQQSKLSTWSENFFPVSWFETGTSRFPVSAVCSYHTDNNYAIFEDLKIQAFKLVILVLMSFTKCSKTYLTFEILKSYHKKIILNETQIIQLHENRLYPIKRISNSIYQYFQYILDFWTFLVRNF